MSLDIKAIKRRIATGIYGDDWITEAKVRGAFPALGTLAAEVERLCAEVERLGGERDAAVDYLCERAEAIRKGEQPRGARELADDIERGEHRREEET